MCFHENNYLAADHRWNLSNGRMSEQSIQAPMAEHVMNRKKDLNNTDWPYMNSDLSSFTCSPSDSNCMIIWNWLCRYKTGNVHSMCIFPQACFIALGWKSYRKGIVLLLLRPAEKCWQHWPTSDRNQHKQMQLSEPKDVRTPMASELSVEVTTTEVTLFYFSTLVHRL